MEQENKPTVDKEAMPDVWLIDKSKGMPAGSRYTFAEVVGLLESYAASLLKDNEELVILLDAAKQEMRKWYDEANKLQSSNEAKEKECEYWKQRCEAAEDYIYSISYHGSTTPDEKRYYAQWQQLKQQKQ